MKLSTLLPLIFSVFTFSAQAANVAVVDSGTDFTHLGLSQNAWTQTNEVPANRIDDNQNGKVDDLHGWNFIDNYSRVFFPEHLGHINPVVYDLLTVIAHVQAGTATEEEQKFLEENMLKIPDEQKTSLNNHINYFGQYIHGTHVAGIVLAQNPNAKIMAARVFPDQAPPLHNPEAVIETQGITDWLYKLLAIVTNGTFHAVGEYLNETQMDVANYSLGMNLGPLAEQILKLKGNKSPTDEEIAAEAERMYAQYEPEGIKWMTAAPNTLFVIAAGNSASDNDVLPAFPANIRLDNTISVAASQAYEKLASFSNFGATTVDVAAPGVAIMSAVPSLDKSASLPLSGTSMAAPFVTGVASRMKDANPELSPAQMREILMSTVDVKDWLKGKVISSGIINPERAVKAAELSREMSVKEATERANLTVKDVPEDSFGPQFEYESPKALKELAEQFVF